MSSPYVYLLRDKTYTQKALCDHKKIFSSSCFLRDNWKKIFISGLQKIFKNYILFVKENDKLDIKLHIDNWWICLSQMHRLKQTNKQTKSINFCSCLYLQILCHVFPQSDDSHSWREWSCYKTHCHLLLIFQGKTMVKDRVRQWLKCLTSWWYLENQYSQYFLKLIVIYFSFFKVRLWSRTG